MSAPGPHSLTGRDGPDRAIPELRFPAALPISERRDDIAEAIRAHQVVVVAGETGSGKTTQLPKICLALGRGRQRRIGHTQPRRIAARAVAERIAAELGTPLGGCIGYQVRFEETVSDESAVKVMTDGILLNELQRDRQLRQYDTLIIDEAHERSLNIDFLLGYLKRLLPRRPDLKLVITSATIDVERFSRHFGDAPVVEVSGRSYPVDVLHLGDAPAADGTDSAVVACVEAIRDRVYGRPGDTLVFLPGEREIRDLARALRLLDGIDVLPLYARLSRAEQARVFSPSGSSVRVRVILATNVAETSLTVPGIRYVIDTGVARISRYSHRSRIQRLPVEPISQASADQRAGRCGRVGPGVCLRLYSEQDYLSRPRYTEPEILRTNLAAVILQMLQLGLGRVSKFPFVDQPDTRLVRDGYRLLEELGAVDGEGRLTALGGRMARVPADPTLSRMLFAAQDNGVFAEVLVIVSGLSVLDPRERPADRQQQADQAHARFRHPRSDFMDWLTLWSYLESQRQELSSSALRRLCEREFLSFPRVREWRAVHRQLLLAFRAAGLRAPVALRDEADYAGIHRSLLAGLLGNVAMREEGREYLAARNRRLQLFPGSSQHRKPPPWVVAGEIVETSRVFARSVGAIEPEWLLDINPSLLRYQHAEPHWHRASGRVMALRRTQLFGLTIRSRERVPFATVDPQAARDILIREALVAGRMRRPPAFLRANLALVSEVEDLEARVRRRDLLVDEDALYAFYAARLPDGVCSAAQLDRWLRRHAGADTLMRLRRGDLLLRDPGAVLDQFPDALSWAGNDFVLSYRFEPGGEADGVSIDVPVALLNRLPRERLDWLVPGLLREKCILLLKGLPKALRRQLVPVPDVVDRILATLEPGDRSLTASLSEALRRERGVLIRDEEWAAAPLDPFYLMNVRVLDADGRLLAQGRDFDALAARFRAATAREVAAAPASGPQRRGVEAWDFGDLPERHSFAQAGMTVTGFPALARRDDRLDIALFDYPHEAAAAHRAGVLALLERELKQGTRTLRRQLLRDNRSALHLAAAALERDAIVEGLMSAALAEASGLDENCRQQADFEVGLASARARIGSVATELARHVETALEALAGAHRELSEAGDPQLRGDVRQQVERMFAPWALSLLPAAGFRHLPRYCRAIAVRCERLRASPARDARQRELHGTLEAPVLALEREHAAVFVVCEDARWYRWALEEWRVSLFAQHLGTSHPVSEKRMRAAWGPVLACCARYGIRGGEVS